MTYWLCNRYFRVLLNGLNRRFGIWGLVRSFPCKKMKVGNREILKPMDDGCDELWVDFNLVPKVIRVYCQKHPSVDMDIKWDSMAIEASDIGRFDIDKLQGKKIAINFFGQHSFGHIELRKSNILSGSCHLDRASNVEYRTRATITRSWSVTALVYKPRILGLKNEEFPLLVHKLSVI